MQSQMVLQSSRSLADLAEQSVIPADYLYTLIIFFMFMVRSSLASLWPKQRTHDDASWAPLCVFDGLCTAELHATTANKRSVMVAGAGSRVLHDGQPHGQIPAPGHADGGHLLVRCFS